MWGNALAINSALWYASLTYFFYAVFAAILLAAWKALAIAALIVVILTLTEIVFGALSE